MPTSVCQQGGDFQGAKRLFTISAGSQRPPHRADFDRRGGWQLPGTLLWTGIQIRVIPGKDAV
jgi:hypothetical protein